MQASLLVYRLPPKTPALTVNKFCQRLYGQKTTSWKGRYHYRRSGLLDDIPHRRLGKGILIVRKQDQVKLTDFLAEWKALYEVRPVEPNQEDLTHLSPSS